MLYYKDPKRREIGSLTSDSLLQAKMSIGVNATNVGWTDSNRDHHRDMTEIAVRWPHG